MLLEKNAQLELPTKPRLDTRVKPHIRLIGAELDDDPNSPSLVVVGRLDQATFRFLKVDNTYQRPLQYRKDIWEAYREGKMVPSIDIGIRGQDYHTDGKDMVITDDAYIIDGWQRIGTALRMMEENPGVMIRIFAMVHFDTSQNWEGHRFTELNRNLTKVSSNLHLRNMRDKNDAILTLYGLCHSQKDFALNGRVCWSQNSTREHLITAVTLAKASMYLHAHHIGLSDGGVSKTAEANLLAVKEISMQTFRRNVWTFFDVIESCWGIRNVEYKNGAPQLKTTFLQTLARIFSDHLEFWDGKNLVVNADTRRKLAMFKVHDPQIASLSAAGGQATKLLREIMVNHINSGRRQNRLQPRPPKILKP